MLQPPRSRRRSGSEESKEMPETNFAYKDPIVAWGMKNLKFILPTILCAVILGEVVTGYLFPLLIEG